MAARCLLAKVAMRLALLAEACDGCFTSYHARLCRMLLDHAHDLIKRIETITALLDEAIGALEARADETPTAALDSDTSEVLAPPLAYLSAIERIAEIPGGGPETARAVIGEIGLDIAVFSTPQRLCSWAKCSPRTVQSGRKTKGAPTGKANPYLKAALGQMATGAARTDTFLGERYRRLVKRMPKRKALAAVSRDRALDPRRHLPPALGSERDLHRPRTRLLREAHRPKEAHRPARPSARGARPPRHLGPRRLSNHGH